MTTTATPQPRNARNKTMVAIAIGYTSFAAAYAVGWLLFPRAPFVAVSTEDAVFLALRWLSLPSLFLIVLMQSLWRLFDKSPEAEDPFAGKESHRFCVNQRVMTNSIEQLVMFAPLLVALATVVPPERAFLIPLHAVLWTAGRALFWGGYHVALHWRAPGFDWTFGTAAMTATWLVIEWGL